MELYKDLNMIAKYYKFKRNKEIYVFKYFMQDEILSIKMSIFGINKPPRKYFHNFYRWKLVLEDINENGTYMELRYKIIKGE